MEATAPAFGALLKHYRMAAGLTQEELAERAGLSVRGIMYLEHGGRSPHRDTIRRLGQALGLAPQVATVLEAAVPCRAPAGQAPKTNLPLQVSSFIGREWERAIVLGREGQGGTLRPFASPNLYTKSAFYF